MKIGISSESDIGQLHKLINDCYGKESLKGWTTEVVLLDTIRTTPAELLEQIRNPTLDILKCTDEESDTILACVLTKHLYRADDENENEMHTGMLCVQPDLQSKGLGRLMMKAVEDHARKLNCTILKMEVISARKELIAWYERLGFNRNGREVPFPEPDVQFKNPDVPPVLIEMEKLIN